MAKLHPDNQIALTQEALTLVLGAYGIDEFSFEPINEGISNSSARIKSGSKKFVLRVYAQGKEDGDILFEINFQDYLRAHGIPIPVIHKNKNGEELTSFEVDGKSWQAILMDLVEGQSITTQPSYELIGELATIQAKMHLLGMEFATTVDRPRKLWIDLREGHVSKVENTTVGGQEVRSLIERIKNYSYPLNPKLPYGYNHLDLDFDGNVITKENKLSGIVDFEDLQYSPVIACLGFSLWNILDDEGLDAMKHYLQVYEKVRPLTALEYEALPNVVFFRNYVMVVIRLLLWDKDTPIEDITDLLTLEKDIPVLLGSLQSNDN
jgi:ethanolamine-phosphate phospho-lyase